MEGIRRQPALRAGRAALFAALCVTLSSTSHVLLSHAPLPLTAVAGAYAAIFALAYALGGRTGGFWPIAGLMVPLELATDTLFTTGQRTCYGPGGGPVTGSWRSLNEALLCHGETVGSPLAGVPGAPAATDPTTGPWLLLAAHVCVGLLASWWLRRGEAGVHRVLRAAVATAFRPLLVAVAALAGAAAHPYRVGALARRAGAVHPRPLLHSVVRRGPPVPAAF